MIRVQLSMITLAAWATLACAGKDHPDTTHDRAHPAGSIQVAAFQAEPTVVRPGHAVVLVAHFQPGHGEIDSGVGPVFSGQPVVVCPTHDTVYTLTVRLGEGRRVTRAVSVRIQPQPR